MKAQPLAWMPLSGPGDEAIHAEERRAIADLGDRLDVGMTGQGAGRVGVEAVFLTLVECPVNDYLFVG